MGLGPTDTEIEIPAGGIAVEQVQDFSIHATFRRQTAKDFVSPLDVPPHRLPLRERPPWRGLRHAIARRLV